MEKAEKIIVVLLILAIIFSGVSVVVNLVVLNADFSPGSWFSKSDSGKLNGNVNLFVESEGEVVKWNLKNYF